VIVCTGHVEIGHLGIFVSTRIARKEHKEIIVSFDMLTYLLPGLCEMRIEEDPDQAVAAIGRELKPQERAVLEKIKAALHG
jgi:hypothetical protein